ncbi:unnamed protein product [Sphagnum balticum]
MEQQQQQQQLGCGKSAVVVPQGISLREPRLEDLEELSNMAYQTYADYNKSVGVPIEVAFDSPQAAWTMLHLFITSSSRTGVVAVEESSGALLGAAFTTTGGEVSGVGPVFVDPTRQSKGVGKAIMQELIRKAKLSNPRSIRLSQTATNMTSFSMYANLGFIPVEGWMEFAGIVTPKNAVIANSAVGLSPLTGAKVCQMEEKDISACAKLHLEALGYDREEELREAHQKGFSTWVVTQNDEIVAYTTGFNLLGHAVAKSEEALVFLFTEVSQQHKSGRLPAIHVAGRLYPRLVQWCLAAKLKLLRLQWYMAMGFYQAPQHSIVWCPGGQH